MNMELVAPDGSVYQSYENTTLTQRLQTKCTIDITQHIPQQGELTLENWNPQPVLDVLNDAQAHVEQLAGSVHPIPGEELISSENTILQLLRDPAISNLQQSTRDGQAIAFYTRNEQRADPERDPLLAQIAQLCDFLRTYQLGNYTLRIA